jgi:hypothetical protein
LTLLNLKLAVGPAISARLDALVRASESDGSNVLEKT